MRNTASSNGLPAAGVPTVNVLGVRISAVNMELALATLDCWIAERTPHYVCLRDVHGVILSQDDAELRAIHNRAGLVTPDGMPLVWLSKLHGHRHVERVYGPDLMLALCAHSPARGYRHFLYGSSDAVLEKLRANLTARFPGLAIVGSYSPPFRPLTQAEDDAVVEMLNAAAPDIVWVGLSTPKQERWMAAHLDRLQAPALIGVGAAFDFHAGTKPQAPRWMQRSGLEWLFRLATEPARLWKRYLVYSPRFVYLTALQLSGLRRFPADGDA
jgi:N-acetylglucosaminyldiphosphoundecaprenol N-acetyl-beta-D-mannosaminyltransferase